MKKTILTLGMSLSCLFLLAACADTGTTSHPIVSPTTNPQSGQMQNEQQLNQNTSLNILSTSQEQPQISETDQVAYNGALQLQDLTYCEKITSEDLKKQCVTNVNNKINEDEAIRKLDPTLCDKLEGDDAKSACKLQIDIAKQADIDNAPPTEEENLLYARALKEKNVKLCEEIKNKDLMTSCKINLGQ